MDFNEVERFKENFAPSANPRCALIVQKSVSSGAKLDADTLATIDSFEERLRNHPGEAITDVNSATVTAKIWREYCYFIRDRTINWGTSRLLALLERCVVSGELPLNEYTKDLADVVAIIILFASVHPRPLDVWKLVDAYQCGVTRSQFYCEYARTLEHAGLYHAARVVYERGISAKALPQSTLATRYKAFRSRRSGDLQLLPVPAGPTDHSEARHATRPPLCTLSTNPTSEVARPHRRRLDLEQENSAVRQPLSQTRGSQVQQLLPSAPVAPSSSSSGEHGGNSPIDVYIDSSVATSSEPASDAATEPRKLPPLSTMSAVCIRENSLGIPPAAVFAQGRTQPGTGAGTTAAPASYVFEIPEDDDCK